MKTFDVKVYFSGYTTKQVQAECESDAIREARKAVFDSIGLVKPGHEHYVQEFKDVIDTLEDWRDADTAEEVVQ